MSLYNIVREKILENKKRKENGGFNGIPMPFKRLSQYIPSLDKGMSLGILGSTGTGKSKFGRFLGLYNSYTFAKKYNYPLKVIIFALEDDVIKVYKNLICHYLWELYNIKISLAELDSKGERTLPDFVVDRLEEAKEFFSDFEKIVTLVNGVSEPKEMYKLLEKYALKTGNLIPYEIEIDGEIRIQERYESEYHTIVIIDNFANIDEGSEHNSERAAIVDLAKKYIREKCCNLFNFTVIQILQNDFASERPTFNTNGKIISAKLEPSLASIGEAKTVSRSQHLVISLFNPSNFDLVSYPEVSKENEDRAYRIDILGNRFRSLKILKNNDGECNIKIGIIFDAFSETWEELPLPNSEEMQAIYSKLNGKPKFQKSQNVLQFEPIEYEEPPF